MIFDCVNWCKEGEGDTQSLESKQFDIQQKKIQDFKDALMRKPIDNEAMQKGRQYEKDVYDGKDDIFSPLVKGGSFQLTATKEVVVDDIPLMLYGVLDVLKAGKIMDIKRVGSYQSGKYSSSHQHPMYLTLIPEAIDFTYLICDDKGNHHLEQYSREDSEDILTVCSQFMSWLKANDLWEIYKQNWDNETLSAKAERRNLQNVKRL